MTKLTITNGTLNASKSCDLCSHQRMCKYYNKAKELFNSNEFYEMNKYLESNNNLQAWSDNSSCQFYTPYLFNKDLLIAETKREKTSLNLISWTDIVISYFKETKLEKYTEYFKTRLEEVKVNNTWSKGKTDDELFRHCFQLSYSNHQFYLKGHNGVWIEVIDLVDVLEYFNAFENGK